MNKQAGINGTLKEKLFSRPTPLKSIRKEYACLHNRIFPGKELFLEFLDASEEQRKKAVARDILLRLCYESNFPPIYELLLNLLKMEEKISADNESEYMGRDHFIHLVNLYLLGIYLFFYNAEFHKGVTDQFHMNRSAKSHEGVKFHKLKDALSSWKYFVLYHDLAYPLERFSPKNGAVNYKISDPSLKLFSAKEFFENFINELSIKALTKILVISNELEEISDDFINVREYFFRVSTPLSISYENDRYISSVSINSTELKILMDQIENSSSGSRDICRLSSVHTGESLKYFFSFFKESAIICVVSAKDTENIVGVIWPKNDQKDYTVLTDERSHYFDKPSLFYRDDFPYTNLKLDYYLINPISIFESALMEIFTLRRRTDPPSQIRSDLNKALHAIIDCDKSHSISSDRDFMDHIFAVYKKVREKYFRTGKTVSMVDVEESEIVEGHKKIADNITELLINEIKAEIKNVVVDRNKIDSNGEMIDQCVDKIIGRVQKIDWNIRKDAIKKSLKDKYVEKIRAFLRIHEEKANCTGLVSHYLNVNQMFIDINMDEISKKIVSTNDSIFKDFQDDRIIGLLENKLKKQISGLTLETFVKKYNHPRAIYDHGIYAGKIFLQHLHLYRKCFLEGNLPTVSQNDKTKYLLPWNVILDQEIIRDKFLVDYTKIISEVAYALIVHNLYPSNFEGDYCRFKTDLKKEAFAYFAMVADSLQQWNRPILYNPAFDNVEETKKVLSNFFDIEVTEKEICVTVTSNSNSESIERINVFATNLNAYLKNASRIIKVFPQNH